MLLKSLKTLLGFGLLGFVSVWIGCSASAPVAPSAGKSLTDGTGTASTDDGTGTASADSWFTDSNLEAAVRTALGFPATRPISVVDIASLTVLKADSKNIRSLAGLEHAWGLDSLSLLNNKITDVSPLAGLTNLKYLNLHTNQLTSSQISPLTSLTNLEELWLDQQGRDEQGNKRLTDVNSLATLTNLKRLRLRANKGITNVDSLGSLTNLEFLDLSNTEVSDLSPLTCLTNLKRLQLFKVARRFLSADSVNIYIPFFRAQGVVVRLALPGHKEELRYLESVGLSPGPR